MVNVLKAFCFIILNASHALIHWAPFCCSYMMCIHTVRKNHRYILTAEKQEEFRYDFPLPKVQKELQLKSQTV